MKQPRYLITALLATIVMMSCGLGGKPSAATEYGNSTQPAYSENRTAAGPATEDMSAESTESNAAENSTTEIKDLELPTGNSQLSSTVRRRTSYTVSYNHDTKQPNWVAWVLTADHATGDVKRMSFEDDDDMPDPKGYVADYYNSGFDRGHLCPAADNKWSEDAMRDCFLITNICPQNASLNSGVWNTIEKQCRTWAETYGRIYIVCGPIYLNREHRHIGKDKVTVPEAFFKVVLCMEGTPKAIGFVCRNQSQKGRKKNEFVNTIDQVERITGYDFFSKLPDDIENVVESKCDINDWE